MHERLIAAAVLAVMVSSCSSVTDTTDFLAAGPAQSDSSQARAAIAADMQDDPVKTAASEKPITGKPTTGKPVADTTAADTAAAEKPADAKAAVAAPVAVAEADTPPPAQARGLLAMFRAVAAPAPAAEAAEAAANAEAAPAKTEPSAKPDPAAKPEAAAVAAPAPAKAAAADPAPGDGGDGGDEISEADLAGEVEADPTKVPVPEEPADDGLAHDFVNVYTSKPQAPVETVPGLPGVTWDGNLVLASRTPDGDPGSFFGGENQPYAHVVPGMPAQVVQAANGLLLANASINVSCVKPELVSMVRRAEGHFGRKVVVTSGYRSPAHNRRVHGATHSQHMYCAALDLFMPGVARDDLARFFFAQPDRGGIGLYCHTRSIHVDVGRRRQWVWSCRHRG